MSEMMSWPLSDSGLPIRVVNACTANHIHSLADLRALPDPERLALPHFGKTSLDHCREYFNLCDKLAAGELHITSLKHWMETFVSEDGYEVLSTRYGFFRTDQGAGHRYFTLQEIANQTGRSRERIRQVEAASLQVLQTKLPRIGLAALAGQVAAWLETQEGTAGWSELQTMSQIEHYDGATPAAVTFFLGSQVPETLLLREEGASSLSKPEWDQALSALDSILTGRTASLSLQELISSVRSSLDSPIPGNRLGKMLQLYLQEAEDAVCTRDLAICGPRRACLIELCQNACAGQAGPIHFREITREVNRQLVPKQGAGAGTILKCLNDRVFQRLDFGLYQLAPESSYS